MIEARGEMVAQIYRIKYSLTNFWTRSSVRSYLLETFHNMYRDRGGGWREVVSYIKNHRACFVFSVSLIQFSAR